LFNVGSVGNHLSAPAAAYAILTGVPDSAETAPFSASFAQAPYDIDAELTVARQLGLPEYDAYALELREGTYSGRKQALSDIAGQRELIRYWCPARTEPTGLQHTDFPARKTAPCP
jgi:hypothetical protein